MRSKSGLGVAAAIMCAGACAVPITELSAQSYPSKPIRMIVPWPAGGGSDIVARILTQKMTEQIGQPFVVDNRGGAAGTIGSGMVAKAAPDGYTLLFGNTATNVTNAVLYTKLDYDIAADFAPVYLVASSISILSVTPSLAVKSIQELIALAKAKPGYLNYGTGGVGSNPHFASALFTYMSGTQMTHVPYKGGAGHTPAVVAGQVHFNITHPLEVMQYIKAGRLRALAVTSAKRSAFAPELPTIAESGVPGYEFVDWWGVLAPAGTPKSLVSKMYLEIVKTLHTSDIKDSFAMQNIDLVDNSPEQFAKQINTELTKWRKVAQQIGIQGD